MKRRGQVWIEKAYTSLRRVCRLQVKFSNGHCPVAHFGASNGRNWPIGAPQHVCYPFSTVARSSDGAHDL